MSFLLFALNICRFSDVFNFNRNLDYMYILGWKQKYDTSYSPRGQVEVSTECHASAPPPPLPPPPFLWQREPVWLPRKQAFSMAMLEHVGRAGRLCFVCDEGFSPCMFNRQTYGPKPNSRAHLPQPDYVQWSFWHRCFASFIMLCSSHHGHLSYCCTGLLMSPAETTDSQTKQGRHTCVFLTATEICLGK